MWQEFRSRIWSSEWGQRLQRAAQVKPILKGVPYWASGILVGILAVFYSGTFSRCIDFPRYILEHHPYWLFAISPFCFVLGAWLVARFAPTAGGTGVPQTIRALNMEPGNPEVHSILSLRVALVIIASSLLGVLGGGGLGREGPMVQIGACAFYVVGRLFAPITPFVEHRSWVMAGAAAGVAAAFQAPLAGVVFVLEELAQTHFHKFKTAVLSAAIIAGVVAQWATGRYLFLGYPQIGDVPLSSIPWALGLGIVAGVLAAPFHAMFAPRFRSFLSQYLRTRFQYAAVGGAAVAAIAIFINRESVGGGVSVIQSLLFDPTFRADWTLVVARFLSTTITNLSGVSGGFLAPALTLGGAIGSLFATLTEYPNHNLLVMVGMSAFLSAVVRAPFTAWVIVMEMTDRHSAIFPLMVASLASFASLRFIEQLLTPTSKTPVEPSG